MNPDPACRPEFVESERSVLELTSLRHPCVIPGIASDFIPNDTVLGGQSPNMVLLTGPNMGGKSTLLRQVKQHLGYHMDPKEWAKVI